MPGWSDRVRIVPGNRGYAFTPGDVLVDISDEGALDVASKLIGRAVESEAVGEHQRPRLADSEFLPFDFLRVRGVADVPAVVSLLRAAGLRAQPNHVFFLDVDANPVHGNPVHGNPVHGNPVRGNPVRGNPVHGNPVHGNGVDTTGAALACCGCVLRHGSEEATPPQPVVGASLTYPSPLYAREVYNPAVGLRYEMCGERTSAAIPLYGVDLSLANVPWDAAAAVRVAVIDTGWPVPQTDLDSRFGPSVVRANAVQNEDADGDVPDIEPDRYLDPVSGHGMFVAGVIKQYAPQAAVRVVKALTTYGDGSEVDIVAAICRLIDDPNPPHIINMSFGTYTPEEPVLLRKAIRAAIVAGIAVVASAGNDGTSRPQYPAAYEGVVSVAALGPNGPADFSNWGDWVKACAPGVDVASTFWFFDGKAGGNAGADGDHYEGWALWSGTSFAAPIVASAIANAVGGRTAHDAVAVVIHHPRLYRLPSYGTVVNPPPAVARI